MKLTQSHLARFCALNDVRVYMAKPIRAGSWLYATNGYVAIRVTDDRRAGDADDAVIS